MSTENYGDLAEPMIPVSIKCEGESAEGCDPRRVWSVFGRQPSSEFHFCWIDPIENAAVKCGSGNA